MKSGIKIIKRDSLGKQNSFPVHSAEKTEEQRDTVSTVQGWVAEWQERKRSLQMAAVAFVRALDQSPESSGQPVSVNS